MAQEFARGAAELIARDGICGLRYDQVAEVNKTQRLPQLARSVRADRRRARHLRRRRRALHDSGDIDADLVDFLEALAAATASSRGRALLTAVASARENPDLRTVVDDVFDRRLSTLDDRLKSAIERGDLPPGETSFVAEMLAGLRATHST